MTEVTGGIHSGLCVTGVSLTDAQLSDVDVVRANLWRVRMRGVWIGEVEIDGQIEGLRINGVDVGPLIEAELDRRHPQRAAMRPDDVAGFHAAWDVLESLWAGTVDRARALPPELLHEQVDGEWSFVQTLRHLLYATDIWVRRAILGDPTPWHPLSLPFDGMEQGPAVPCDRPLRRLDPAARRRGGPVLRRLRAGRRRDDRAGPRLGRAQGHGPDRDRTEREAGPARWQADLGTGGIRHAGPGAGGVIRARTGLGARRGRAPRSGGAPTPR